MKRNRVCMLVCIEGKRQISRHARRLKTCWLQKACEEGVRVQFAENFSLYAFPCIQKHKFEFQMMMMKGKMVMMMRIGGEERNKPSVDFYQYITTKMHVMLLPTACFNDWPADDFFAFLTWNSCWCCCTKLSIHF